MNFKEYLDKAEQEPATEELAEDTVTEQPKPPTTGSGVSEAIKLPSNPAGIKKTDKSITSRIMKEDVPLKTDKRLLEALKTANSQNKRLIESLDNNNKLFLEAISQLSMTNESLLETNKQIVTKLEELQAIEIPAPIVQIQPARITERKIIRDPETKLMSGFIDIPGEEEE